MIKIKYFEYLIFIIYFILILLEVKKFIIWGQITNVLVPNEMLNNYEIITNLIETNHPHILRILLIVPFYAISEYISIDLELFFSITLMMFIFILYYLHLKILNSIVSREKLFFILLFFLGLSFLMHGRIMFSILGNTILLFLLYKSFYSSYKIGKFKFLVLFIIALWFVSVSSGTFIVFLLTILIFYTIQALIKLPYISKELLFSFSMFLLLILLISPIIMVFVEKNLNYYDGSIVNMLSHGAGRYLIDYFYIVLPLLMLFILFLPIFLRYLKKYRILILPASMIISSLVVGLFGFSSLVSGISAYIVFIYLFINRQKIKGVQYF